MNFQGNFRKLGEADISEIKGLVEQLTDAQWLQDDTRQKRYEVHKDTQFIGLVYDEDFRHTDATRRPALQVFAPALQPFLAQIADFYESDAETLAKFDGEVRGYFIRVSLAKLVAGGKISIHQDMNFSLTHSHRVHIPIVTNDQVYFYVGKERINMKEGEIYEINNRRMHYVANHGDEDRVHLILDWVFPWEPCCCANKHHPGVPCTPKACVDTVQLRVPCNCHPEENDMASEFTLSVS